MHAPDASVTYARGNCAHGELIIVEDTIRWRAGACGGLSSVRETVPEYYRGHVTQEADDTVLQEAIQLGRRRHPSGRARRGATSSHNQSLLLHLALGGSLALLAGCETRSSPETSWDQCRASFETPEQPVVHADEFEPCDPSYPAVEKPALQWPLVAGIDADGTLYVIDTLKGNPRLFIGSKDDVRRSSGLRGHSVADDAGVRESIVRIVPPLQVVVDSTDRHFGPLARVKMWVLDDPEHTGSDFAEAKQQGRELSTINACDLADLNVLPADPPYFARYAARNDSNDVLLVVVPLDFIAGNGQPWVFFGRDNQAQQRETGVLSAKGRSGARIDFVLDDSNATAVFGEGCSSPNGDCAAYVEVSGERVAEFDQVVEHDTLPAPAAEFFCMAAKDGNP